MKVRVGQSIFELIYSVIDAVRHFIGLDDRNVTLGNTLIPKGSRLDLIESVSEVFRRYIGPGTRGNSPVNIDNLLGQLKETTDTQLESFLSLHEITMNLGSGVTPHATGRKGLFFDYWSD